jgi:hypothetical protein
MTTPATATTRRSIGVAALCLALAGLGGCMTAPQGTVPDSLSTYDRTFDNALRAMVDQKLTISHQDRRQGTIIGSLAGTTIAATLEPQYYGTIRVVFKQQGATPPDPELLKRVADAYNARMASQEKILPGGLL